MPSAPDFMEQLELLFDVDDRWRDWQGDPPEVVYHYTKAVTLRRILETKRLWGTRSSQLNDRREVDHALDILRRVLVARSSTIHPNQDMYPEEVTAVRYPPDLITTFLASMSGAEDDLSQWCMYGDAFSGLALGFDSAVLVALDAADDIPQPVGFFKVLYDEAEQKEHFEQLASRWEDHVASAWRRLLPAEGSVRKHRASLFARMLVAGLSVAPRMKSHYFASENEWRLAHLHNRHQSDCEVFMDAERQHVALNLGQLTGVLPLVSVWLGPAVANDKSEDLVRKLLSQYGRDDVIVRRSEIPLRGEERQITV